VRKRKAEKLEPETGQKQWKERKADSREKRTRQVFGSICLYRQNTRYNLRRIKNYIISNITWPRSFLPFQSPSGGCSRVGSRATCIYNRVSMVRHARV